MKELKEETQAITAARLSSIPMFFIIGKGRSGTTLLQTMLDANPHVLIPLESRFVIHLKSKYGHIKRWNEEKILQFYEDIFTDMFFNLLWEVDRKKLKNDLLALGEEATFGLLCKVVYLNYRSIFGKEDIKLIGDKNPIYSIFTDDLLRIYPGSKFIHLVRDYRANIHSHRAVFPVKNVAFLTSKWKLYNEKAEQLGQRYPGQVLTVRYEDLVDDPAQQVQKVCAFLGVEFMPAMMEFHRKTSMSYERLGTYIDKYHSNLLNPVNKSKVDVWRTEMELRHVHTCDRIAGDQAENYGYEKQFNSSSLKLELQAALSSVKLHVWVFVMKTYYNSPLWMRAMTTSFFKLLFGKDYQKKKQL